MTEDYQLPHRRLFLGCPTAQGQVSCGFSLSLSHMIDDTHHYGFDFLVHYFSGMSGNIAGARNHIAALFLQSDYTDLFFIDSDISWGPNAVGKLLTAPVDIVSGVYRAKTGRTDIINYHCNPITTDGKWQMDAKLKLLPVSMAPTGFMRIRRSVIEQMVDADRDNWYVDPLHPKLKIYNLFEFKLDKKVRNLLTEDNVFCQKWIALGGQIWADPMIDLGHTGTCVYAGSLSEHMVLDQTVN